MLKKLSLPRCTTAVINTLIAILESKVVCNSPDMLLELDIEDVTPDENRGMTKVFRVKCATQEGVYSFVICMIGAFSDRPFPRQVIGFFCKRTHTRAQRLMEPKTFCLSIIKDSLTNSAYLYKVKKKVEIGKLIGISEEEYLRQSVRKVLQIL